MDSKQFKKDMTKLLPECTEQTLDGWITFAKNCVASEQYVEFIELPDEQAVSAWLDSFYASFYFLKKEFGQKAAAKVVELSSARLCLYPYEMKEAAIALQKGCSNEDISQMIEYGLLDGDLNVPTMADVKMDLKKGKTKER